MKALLFLLMVLSASISWAQLESKGPRVIELEEKIEADAAKYLNQRFPGSPYFIKVDVQPLRADVQKGQHVESLPYLNYETDDFSDAWDDPNISIMYLRNRVKRIALEVSVSDALKDSDLLEIKDSLMSYLKLISFRDEIKVERKLHVEKESIPEYVFYLLGALVVLLVGVGIWLKFSIKTIAKSVGQSSSANSASAVPMMNSGTGNSSESKFTVKDVPPLRGDINFFDPIKLIEVLHLKIKQVVSSSHFPTLQDMIFLKVYQKIILGH